MLLYPIKELQFLSRHAKRHGNIWVCKSTSAAVRFNPVELEVVGPLPSDIKKKHVSFPWCPLCTLDPQFPEPGTRIRSSDLAPMGL